MARKSFSKSYDIIFLAQEEEPVIAATEPGIYAVPYLSLIHI